MNLNLRVSTSLYTHVNIKGRNVDYLTNFVVQYMQACFCNSPCWTIIRLHFIFISFFFLLKEQFIILRCTGGLHFGRNCGTHQTCQWNTSILNPNDIICQPCCNCERQYGWSMQQDTQEQFMAMKKPSKRCGWVVNINSPSHKIKEMLIMMVFVLAEGAP